MWSIHITFTDMAVVLFWQPLIVQLYQMTYMVKLSAFTVSPKNPRSYIIPLKPIVPVSRRPSGYHTTNSSKLGKHSRQKRVDDVSFSTGWVSRFHVCLRGDVTCIYNLLQIYMWMVNVYFFFSLYIMYLSACLSILPPGTWCIHTS